MPPPRKKKFTVSTIEASSKRTDSRDRSTYFASTSEQLSQAGGGGFSDEEGIDDGAWEEPSMQQEVHLNASMQPERNASRPPRTAAERNAAASSNWAGAFPELIWQRYVSLGSDAKAREHLKMKQHMLAVLNEAVQEQLELGCRFCGGAVSGLQLSPKRKIVCVDMNGSFELDEQRFKCSSCGTEHNVHPSSIGFFPATPMEPTTWYSDGLMVTTCSVMKECAIAMHAWVQSLLVLHAHYGFDTSHRHLRNLGTAAMVWQQVQHESSSRAVLGLQPIVQGGFDSCPCCWRECSALSLDSCLGLRQLRNVGSASVGLPSFMPETFFIPVADVRAELQGQNNASVPSAYTDYSCAQFKAATHTGTRREHYKCMGIAAACCRHAKIFTAASLQTEESTGYYVLLLEKCFMAFNSSNSRSLTTIFLDIACQFQGAFDRLIQRLEAKNPAAAAAATAAKLAIGPWHLLPHKARCHVLFNPKLMEGTGETYGDVIEQLWALLRPHANVSTYMGDNHREAFLHLVITAIHNRKDMVLAKTLKKAYERATANEQQLKAKLAGQDLSANPPTIQPPLHQVAPRTVTPNMRYVEKLMDLAAMPASTSVVSYAGERRQHERERMELEVKKLEQDLMVQQTWQPSEIPYEHALLELKLHHIERLQLAAEKHIIAIKAHTSALERRNCTTAGRHDVTDLVRAKGRKKAALRSAIQELQFWHALPLHSGQNPLPDAMRYDATSLTPDNVCVDSLPWAPKEWTVPPLLAAQHSHRRAVEEKAIIEREARDAREYYVYHIQECARAMEALELLQAEACTQEAHGMDACNSVFLPGAVHFRYTLAAKKKAVTQLVRGKMRVLCAIKEQYNDRLNEMEGLIAWIEGESMSEALASDGEDELAQDGLIDALQEGALEGMLVHAHGDLE